MAWEWAGLTSGRPWVWLAFPPFLGALLVGASPGLCCRVAWPWAETHTCCCGAVEGVSEEHSTPEQAVHMGHTREARCAVSASPWAYVPPAPPPSPAALPLLLRCPGPAHLRDLLPRGAEGRREGLRHLRGPHGEGGAAQLHQQGGEGEGAAARPSRALSSPPGWSRHWAAPSWPGRGSRAAGPEDPGLSGFLELPFCSGGSGALRPELSVSCALGRG